MNEGKKYKLIEATIAIAAEEGLHGLSMKQVIRRAQTSETLIYQHFENKEGLYYACFQVINRDLQAYLDDYEYDFGKSREDLYEFAHKLWLDFFRYLVDNSQRTRFYFAYRNSSYINSYREEIKESGLKYLMRFDAMFRKINEDHGINLDVDRKCLWSFVLDTTANFSLRVIKGEIEDTPENCEHMWKLLSSGLFGSR